MKHTLYIQSMFQNDYTEDEEIENGDDDVDSSDIDICYI